MELRSLLRGSLVLSVCLPGMALSGLAADPAGPILRYEPIPGRSRVSFSLPYTLGRHDGVSRVVEGFLELKGPSGALVQGRLAVPIRSLDAGNRKLECHLQESLGLDYQVSGFPDSHVCDDKEQLPSEGPNSIRFPKIELTLPAVSSPSAKGELTATWSIHGVTRSQPLSYELEKLASGELRVRAKTSFVLQDFGIIVKNFLFVTVDKVAQSEVDVVLAPRTH
jgi:hypothetical protein